MNDQKITINTDGISDAQKATEKFKSAYREMLAALTAPGFIPVLCAHEAAHMVYLSFIGVKNFDPLPPRLRYDPRIDDYVGHLAAMQALDKPGWEPGKFWDWLFKSACAFAAGGVVARKKMPSSDGGDEADKARFKAICDELNKDPNTKIDFDDWWNRAQLQVAADIENPLNMATIDEQATIIRPLMGL